MTITIGQKLEKNCAENQKVYRDDGYGRARVSRSRQNYYSYLWSPNFSLNAHSNIAILSKLFYYNIVLKGFNYYRYLEQHITISVRFPRGCGLTSTTASVFTGDVCTQ